MPVDMHDDDDDPKAANPDASLRFKDFECPVCNANNPCDPPIGEKDQTLCNYCGTEFSVKVSNGRLKLREM